MRTTPRALERAKVWTAGAVAAAALTTGVAGYHLATSQTTTAASGASTGSSTTTGTTSGTTSSAGGSSTGSSRTSRSSSSASSGSSFSNPGTVSSGNGPSQTTTHGS